MDILDVMLARAMTPQGATETYVAIANAAAEKAEKAEQDAAAAIATVEAAADEIAAAQEAASDLLESAQDALETAQQAQINMPEVYTTTGQNTDGYMTQKAVTDALASKANTSDLADKVTTSQMNTALAAKADASTTATKTYVDQKIAQIPSGGGGSGSSIHMSAEDAGYMVKVDDDGNLAASIIAEENLIDALLQAGTYTAKNAVGLDIDYANRTFTRIQGATNKNMGADFNAYLMYGGRTRCNVSDDGTITAFYGDSSYRDDGSNGQVMIYQPKFYYKRTIRNSDDMNKGKIVRHESLMISTTEQLGFKLAPIFEGNLDYVLLPAYDAGIVDGKLTSIANIIPTHMISREDAEASARARGTGWHIMNLAAFSANQMLEMIEFGYMNGQNAIEQGITYAPSGVSGQCMFLTGSTASLGNATGHATTTIMDINGNRSNVDTDGYRAISYRGMENPWGNLWQMIGGVKITGSGNSAGGEIWVCRDFDYSGNNYSEVGFNLPSSYGWVNAMGYGNDTYDWVYIPAECASSANSQEPIGDTIWTAGNLNGTAVLVTGGSFGFKEECGPFYYGADRSPQDSARWNYGAKLLYIPTKNEIYTTNIAKWQTYMGG